MKDNKFPLIFCLTAALCGGFLRLWSLLVAVDTQGVPMAHSINYVMAAVSVIVLVVFGLLARSAPREGSGTEVIACGLGGYYLLMAAAALFTAGSAMELFESLRSGGIAPAVMCLLGVTSGIFCMIFAYGRGMGKYTHPAFALFPVVYLVVKLILNFKVWSVDPVILDYCVILFALIFTLLAFHRTAGFLLNVGKRRITLFFAMAAVFFCTGSMMDGFMDGSPATVVTYLGFGLWQIPLIAALLRTE